MNVRNAETGGLGTVSWIIQGINLEDTQYIKVYIRLIA
jgi:hypothetical protein